MEKKLIIFFGLCIIVALLFSGCTQQDNGTELDPTIKRIKDAGVLKIGTSAPYEPMEYFDENYSYIGFDIDIASKIADALDVESEFINLDFDLENVFVPALENYQVDIVIAAITIDTDRAQLVDFSRPYLNAGQVIIVNEINTEIEVKEDLENKTVGAQNNTVGQIEAAVYTKNSSLVKVYGDDFTLNAPLDLLNGEIDAIIVDYPAGAVLIKNNPGLKILGEPFTDEYYGIAIKKGENALKKEIDDVIISLTEDAVQGIEYLKLKWLSKE